ncbi:hypothetical protein J2T26_003877 [Citrobacter farmeri]|nr:hypothetical protein [Citrobacter farmeri]MCW2423961.1 hypothetical protein [Citrobacter farmeri]
MTFSGISVFDSGVRTFFFLCPELIYYPQDKNKDNNGFLKYGIIHKE